MKRLTLAAAFVATASASLAGVPTMVLPDLTFPAPSPDISTQGCIVTTDKTPCR